MDRDSLLARRSTVSSNNSRCLAVQALLLKSRLSRSEPARGRPPFFARRADSGTYRRRHAYRLLLFGAKSLASYPLASTAFEKISIRLRARLLLVTAKVGLLDLGNLLIIERDRSAAVPLFADEVNLAAGS